jgi:hypothetical protein
VFGKFWVGVGKVFGGCLGSFLPVFRCIWEVVVGSFGKWFGWFLDGKSK